MRRQAIFYTSIWSDEDWVTLTANAQWLYWTASMQPAISLCGVLPLTPSRWSKLAKGHTPAVVAKALKELVDARFIVVDNSTEEAWVRTFAKWNKIFEQPNLMVGASKDWLTVQSRLIREQFIYALPEGFPQGLSEETRGRLSQPFKDAMEKRFANA